MVGWIKANKIINCKQHFVNYGVLQDKLQAHQCLHIFFRISAPPGAVRWGLLTWQWPCPAWPPATMHKELQSDLWVQSVTELHLFWFFWPSSLVPVNFGWTLQSPGSFKKSPHQSHTPDQLNQNLSGRDPWHLCPFKLPGRSHVQISPGWARERRMRLDNDLFFLIK